MVFDKLKSLYNLDTYRDKTFERSTNNRALRMFQTLHLIDILEGIGGRKKIEKVSIIIDALLSITQNKNSSIDA